MGIQAPSLSRVMINKVGGVASSRQARHLSIVPGTFVNFQEVQVTGLPVQSRAPEDCPRPLGRSPCRCE